MKKINLTSVTAAIVLSSAANASPVIYTSASYDSSGFDMAAVNAGASLSIDNFEDLGPGTIDYGITLARSGYDISADSGNPAIRSISTPPSVIEGSVSMISYNGTDPLTFSFDNAINAFSITFRDLDMNFGGTFTYSIDGTPAETLLISGSGNNQNLFFGVIDQTKTFSAITFDRSVGDGYNYDLVNFGVTNVPVPAAAWFFASSLIGLAGLARRQKATARRPACDVIG